MSRLQSDGNAEGRGLGPFLLACDGGYAAQLATCLRSMVESNRTGWPIDVHVLVEDFPGDLRQRVLDSLPPGSASIRWIDADVTRFNGLPTPDYISRMTFARLLIPDVMPEGTSRLVYLDADILVLNDLAPLWEADLQGRPIGAVIDALDTHIKTNAPGFEEVPRVRSYFNAGILVIDLPRWRQQRVSERAHDYLRRFPSTPYCDQDALNVVCDGDWKQLSTTWNYQGHLSGRIQELSAEEAPAIVHFVTTLKPWKPTSMSVNASLYDSFRKRTLFARTPREIVRESLQASWCRVRRFFGRFAVLRALRDRVSALLGRDERPAQRLKLG